MKDYESRKNAYREQLFDFLNKSNLTINEYAESLGEEYVSQILNPDPEVLDDYIKAFEMFRTMNEYQNTSYVDPDTNLAYSMFDYSLQGLKDKTKYKELEEALFLVMKNPSLKGQLDIDLMTLKSHVGTIDSLIREFSGDSSPMNMLKVFPKMLKNLEKVSTKVNRRLCIECPEMILKSDEFDNASCIKRYILLNEDAYAYLMKQKSTKLEKK